MLQHHRPVTARARHAYIGTALEEVEMNDRKGLALALLIAAISACSSPTGPEREPKPETDEGGKTGVVVAVAAPAPPRG